MPDESAMENPWYVIFAVGDPRLRSFQEFNRKLPRDPRCKLCSAPFRGAGSLLMKLQKRTPSSRNPAYCGLCDAFIRANPGGAEVEVTMLFADVRDSTGLAESLAPAAYGRLINRYYAAVTKILVENDGFIDKLVGDEVIAVFPPGLSGPEYARKAVKAAQKLLRLEVKGWPQSGPVPHGVGVHTGTVYIGTPSGTSGREVDVVMLGDNVNIAARLAARAEPGEALVSDTTLSRAALEAGAWPARQLTLRGKSEAVGAYVIR